MTDTFTEFMQGMSDCEEGLEHEAGKGVDYDRGFAAQYELEQMRTHETMEVK